MVSSCAGELLPADHDVDAIVIHNVVDPNLPPNESCWNFMAGLR